EQCTRDTFIYGTVNKVVVPSKSIRRKGKQKGVQRVRKKTHTLQILPDPIDARLRRLLLPPPPHRTFLLPSQSRACRLGFGEKVGNERDARGRGRRKGKRRGRSSP